MRNSADLNQIAERLKIQLKQQSSNITLAGGFYESYQIKTRHLNYIVRLTYRRSTKKGDKNGKF